MKQPRSRVAHGMARAALAGTVSLAVFAGAGAGSCAGIGSVREAQALGLVGTLRPAAQVIDADGHTLDLRAVNGKPMLVLYEDQESAKLNDAFKADLAHLAKGDRYRSSVALVPVADLQSFDFWPARGFVKDAIRSESKKAGTTIYCDWDGAFQRAAGFKRGTSSVLLVGRNARILFAFEGALGKSERDTVIALLRSEVAAEGGS